MNHWPHKIAMKDALCSVVQVAMNVDMVDVGSCSSITGTVNPIRNNNHIVLPVDVVKKGS
jgi:hypothetical protein